MEAPLFAFLLAEQRCRNLLSGSCTHGWRMEGGGAVGGVLAHNFTMVSEKRPAKHFKWQSSERAALWRRAGSVMIR